MPIQLANLTLHVVIYLWYFFVPHFHLFFLGENLWNRSIRRRLLLLDTSLLLVTVLLLEALLSLNTFRGLRLGPTTSPRSTGREEPSGTREGESFINSEGLKEKKNINYCLWRTRYFKGSIYVICPPTHQVLQKCFRCNQISHATATTYLPEQWLAHSKALRYPSVPSEIHSLLHVHPEWRQSHRRSG